MAIDRYIPYIDEYVYKFIRARARPRVPFYLYRKTIGYLKRGYDGYEGVWKMGYIFKLEFYFWFQRQWKRHKIDFYSNRFDRNKINYTTVRLKNYLKNTLLFPLGGFKIHLDTFRAVFHYCGVPQGRVMVPHIFLQMTFSVNHNVI